jgi:hypothetical protein
VSALAPLDNTELNKHWEIGATYPLA